MSKRFEKEANEKKSRQRKRVQHFQEQLANSDEFPERELRRLWALIKSEKVLPKLDNLNLESPIEALIWCIDLGRYPPPEILLSLKESWWEYLFAAGSITLEDAFIGKSVRKGGNFARRLNNRHQCLWFAFLLLAVCREQPDLSQIDSAAFAVREFALDIDPETLLRKARFANLKAAAGVIDEGLITSAKAAEMAKLFLGSRRKNKRHVIPVRKRPSNDK